MSWLRNDDDMLDHEKWRRALREGGDAALLVWWRLSSWCSRRLTDGRIPADMIAEVACLERSKSRARALQALIDAALCSRQDDGALVIVNYLERNPCRADVLAARDRRAKAQRDYADRRKLTGQRPIALPDPDPVALPERDTAPSQSRPVPIPIPIPSERETRALESDPLAEPEIQYPGPLKPSKRERELTAKAVALNATGTLRHHYAPGWEPTTANQAEGHLLGLTDDEIWAKWDQQKNHRYPTPFDDDERRFSRDLAFAAADKKKGSFQVFKSAKERDAFENPGRERRAGS